MDASNFDSIKLDSQHIALLLAERTGTKKVSLLEVTHAANESPSIYAVGDERLSTCVKLSSTEIRAAIAEKFGIKRSEVSLETTNDEKPRAPTRTSTTVFALVPKPE